MSAVAIFNRVTGSNDPDRELETMSNFDLARLMEELEGERWIENWIAQQMLVGAVRVALARFVALVELGLDTIPE